MFCAKCGVDLPDDARFCSQCGAKVDNGEPVQPDSDDAAEPIPAFAPPPDELPEDDPRSPKSERDVWEGRYSPRAMAPKYFLMAVVTVGLLILTYAASADWTWKWKAVLVVLAVGWAYCLLTYFHRRWSVRYRLTSQRLFVETGIFSCRKDELELLRVDDVNVTQNLLERIFGVGNVVIHSTDASNPELTVAGIDDPDTLKEHVREFTRVLRKRALNVESL